MSAGKQLEIEQNEQNEAIEHALAIATAANGLAMANAERIDALENAAPPDPDPTPDPDPDPDPDPTPDPDPIEPDERLFGVNLGYKDDSLDGNGEPWAPEGQYDDPRYEEYLYPVAKCLRFEWWRANDDVNYAGTLTDERRERIKRYVEICKRMKSDIHICLFLRDNPSTIRWIVGYVKQHLPNATRYIECANEIWNGGSYWDASKREHVVTGRAVFKEVSRLSGMPNYWHGGNTEWFQTCADIVSHALYTAKQEDPDCVTVLGCLTANKWWMEGVEDRMNYKPDCHGLTWYFGAGIGDNPDPHMSIDELFTACETKLPKELGNIRQHAQESKERGRRVTGYEGGPHWIIPGNKHELYRGLSMRMAEANRDPRMVPLINRVAQYAKIEGFERLNHYNYMTIYDVHGYWGLGENLDTIRSNPKYINAAGLSNV